MINSQNIISEDFKCGKNFEIGSFCIIEEDVVVGDNVKIGNFVLLKRGTRIGSNVLIDSYVRSSGQRYILEIMFLFHLMFKLFIVYLMDLKALVYT